MGVEDDRKGKFSPPESPINTYMYSGNCDTYRDDQYCQCQSDSTLVRNSILRRLASEGLVWSCEASRFSHDRACGLYNYSVLMRTWIRLCCFAQGSCAPLQIFTTPNFQTATPTFMRAGLEQLWVQAEPYIQIEIPAGFLCPPRAQCFRVDKAAA